MESGDYYPEKDCPYKTPTKRKMPMKWFIGIVGCVVGVSHIGLLGYLINTGEKKLAEVPVINIPHGPYSSYRIKAGKDGYEIEYRADDPKVLESKKSLNVDRNKKGLFGGGSETRQEYRLDQYTREGTRNMGVGGTTTDSEGKSAEDIECIVADAGARSQGAMAGSALAAGVAVPALSSIPYIGWLAGGWALLLGQKAGSEIGSEIGSILTDC
jgi:hypothetical protein